MFFCEDWSRLAADLADLPDDIVSVSLVADPFGAYTLDMLEVCFDVVNPFKCHYIVDLQGNPEAIGSDHHRKSARRALRKIQVEVCRDPSGFADAWITLYHKLVTRYDISGIRAFSRNAFIRQLSMPEIVVHQAFLDSELVGAQLFYIQDGIAHCHLGAVSDKGYSAGAFYAMDYFSFEYFSGKARKLDLGGGAGLDANADDGLSRYKSGWSSETRTIYFCGRVTNQDRYAALARSRKGDQASYFPAYRCGEFS